MATALGSVEVAAGHDRELSRGERASHRPVAPGGSGARAGRHRQQHGECRHQWIQGTQRALQRIHHAGRKGGCVQADRSAAILCHRQRHAARPVAGRGRTHGQPARRRAEGRQLPRRADAERRALYKGGIAEHRPARPARHPDRAAGDGRIRPDRLRLQRICDAHRRRRHGEQRPGHARQASLRSASPIRPRWSARAPTCSPRRSPPRPPAPRRGSSPARSSARTSRPWSR